MREETLPGCKVAILAANGFHRRRFCEVRGRLAEAGAITTVVSSTPDDLIRSWHPSDDGFCAAVDRRIGDAYPAYDALFMPGTVVDPEAVFIDPRAADFVKSFFDLRRPIASLCRDRWLFVHRNNVLGGRLKAEPALAYDIVLPQSTLTSDADHRESYLDLDGFIRKMLAFFQTSLTLGSRRVSPCADPSRVLDFDTGGGSASAW